MDPHGKPAPAIARPIYKRIFVVAFEEKMMHALLAVAATVSFVSLCRDSLGLFRNILRPAFWIDVLLNSALLVMLLCSRLKVLAEAGRSSIGAHAVSLLLWLASALLLGWTFVRRYDGGLLQLYARHHGMYGSPSLRGQFFVLVNGFLLVGATAAATRLLRGSSLSYSTKADFQSNMHEKAAHALKNVGIRTGLTMGIFLATQVLFASASFRAYFWAVSFLTSALPPKFAWSLLVDIRTLWQLAITSFAAHLLFAICDLAIELIFGQCYWISSKAQQPNQCMLEGLVHSKEPLIQDQAYLEFWSIACHHEARRRTLFADLDGEVAVSRQLCQWALGRLQEYLGKMESNVAALKALDDRISTRHYSRMRSLEPLPNRIRAGEKAASPIFAKKTMPMLERAIKHVLCPETEKQTKNGSADERPPPASPSRTAIPAVLTTAHKHSEVIGSASQAITVSKPYSDPLVSISAGLCRFRAGTVLTRLWICFHKSRYIRSERQRMVWLVEGLASLVAASFEEDRHGQVQFMLAALLEALCDCCLALVRLSAPPKPPLDATDNIVLSHIESNVDAPIKELICTYRAGIERIIAQFQEYLEQLGLGPACRAKLSKLGYSL